jgi:hypothetical protein
MTAKIAIPPTYANNLPTSTSLAALKKTAPVIITASSPLYRAAWNAASVLPLVPNKFYRFGPPKGAIRGKQPPYWWLYIADTISACVYEAQFCAHDTSMPGHFYIDRFAEINGQIASVDFQTDLRLLDITGAPALMMGIHDLLSRPDHHWCKWFAYHLVIEGFFTGRAGFHGLLYPSRKNRGENAIALFSGYVNRVRPKIQGGFNRSSQHF